MIQVSNHDCRTTFAGGINPFIAAGAVRLMPAYEPASRVAGVFCVTQNDILVVLRDGKERMAGADDHLKYKSKGF